MSEDAHRAERRQQLRRYSRLIAMGAQDDLVFALALALFGARMRVLPVAGEEVRRRSGYWS